MLKLNQKSNAMRITAISFGLFCGITGIIAGIFEYLQGPLLIDTFRISTIGPAYSMWEDTTYLAYTLFPDFQTTGIIAIIVSATVCFWSVFLIHKKYGGWEFLVLSIAQLLSGGAFVIDMATTSKVFNFLQETCNQKCFDLRGYVMHDAFQMA